MFNKSGLFLILLALVGLGFLSSVYVVNEYEKAIVLRLGKLEEEKPAPGIHFKIPLFDQVKKFDGRILTLDESAESFYTIQSKRLQVDLFAKWKIEDLDRYYIATGGSEGTARALLSTRINNGLRNEFGQRTLHEVVSGERDQLMESLVEKINETALLELGIHIVDIRVKKIDLPPEVQDSVFNRMRAAREKEAREYRSKGEEQAEVIRSAADREQIVIKANAYREAEQIRGTGDAIATSIYADAYNKRPELYSFLRSLSAYQSAFQSKSDILLIDPDSEFFRYLKDPQGGN